MKVIVFDTETTGFPSPNLGLDKQPYMCEFACITLDFDVDSKILTEVGRKDVLIKIPVEMPLDSAGIHKITDEMLMNEKLFSELADGILEEFRKADVAVAHNLNFDRKIFEIELERLGRDKDFLPGQLFDTMLASKEMCNLPGKFGKVKSPRLGELYYYLFEETFENAHNAIADVEATVRCLQGLADKNLFNPEEPNQGSLF